MCAHEAETARVAGGHRFHGEKPVIAGVSGFALGGGVGLAAGCDLIVTYLKRPLVHALSCRTAEMLSWARASISAVRGLGNRICAEVGVG